MALTLGVNALWAGLDEERYQEIHLQGDYTFLGIIIESERQLGVSIQLPLKADDDLTSTYNQIISLRQLVDAIVVHFAQDNVPLDYHFEAKRLKFSRRDVVDRSRQAPVQNSRPKYPVPMLSDREPSREEPKLPAWAEHTSQPSSSSMDRIEELPMLSRSGIQRHSTERSVPSSSSMLSLDELESSSQNRAQNDPSPDGAFSVTIPQKRQTVVMAPVQSTSGVVRGSSPQSERAPSPVTSPVPSRMGESAPSIQMSPATRPRKTSPMGDARGESFGITPYPEDAVAFINDAPSIVPGAARENYIEWQTRMEGALQNGHRSALANEQKDLERRLLWLRSKLK